MPTIREQLCRLLACCPPAPKPERAVAVRFSLFGVVDPGVNLITLEPEGLQMLKLTSVQAQALEFKALDKKRNPAKVDGAPVWTSSNEAVATVEQSEDGLTAVVKAVGPGTAQVNSTADADLGEGVRQLIGVLDVEVAAAEAVTIEIGTVGAPFDQE
jgi:hypothetical protein